MTNYPSDDVDVISPPVNARHMAAFRVRDLTLAIVNLPVAALHNPFTAARARALIGGSWKERLAERNGSSMAYRKRLAKETAG